MITNERQLLITRKCLAGFRKAIRSYDLKVQTERLGSELLAQAQLDSLKSEEEVLQAQINEYNELWSGAVTSFTACGLDALPAILIRARIARGLTQAAFAERLGMKPQQVQRYESEQYASASLSRLKEVANALGLDIVQMIKFKEKSLVQENVSASLNRLEELATELGLNIRIIEHEERSCVQDPCYVNRHISGGDSDT